MAVLPKRLGRYGLTLQPDKTRLVPFGRPPRRQQDGKGPRHLRASDTRGPRRSADPPQVVERFGTTGAGKEAENALTVLEASIQPEEDSPDD